MAIEVKIPQISEGVESAQVIEILVSEGESIKEEQSVIAVETDKASVEVPSSDAGKVKEIKVKEGDDVRVGDVILILEEENGDQEKEDKETKDSKDKKGDSNKKEKKDKGKKKQEDEKEAEDQDEEKEEGDREDEKGEKNEDDAQKVEERGGEDQKSKNESEDKEKSKGGKGDGGKMDDESHQPQKPKAEDGEKTEGQEDVPASPKIRRLAREIGVDITMIKGSGPGGRITEEDVKSKSKDKEEKDTESKPAELPDFSQWGTVEKEPLSNIRKTTAKHTVQSWQTIPHVFQFDEADISGIEEYMEKSQSKAEAAGGKLTITSILVKVLANGLQQFPIFNASIDMEKEEVIYKKYYSIGIAVDTEKGLLIPVIRDVDKKTIIEIAVEITELAEKTRQGKLSPEDMQGGNISISNLGGIGGTNFTPIVYPPQVAILGLSRAKQQPVFVDGKFEPRQVLPLSLSYDHRLIDGAGGAKFLRWICQALEDPYKALLGA